MDTFATTAAATPASPGQGEKADTFAPFACPMGHGAPAADSPSGGSGRRGYFFPGVLALLAMVGIGAVANLGALDHRGPSRLAGSDVSTFLAQGIQAERGLSAPPSVSCPANEPVRVGLRFVCRWEQGALSRPIQVTETANRQFRFSVGAPG